MITGYGVASSSCITIYGGDVKGNVQGFVM
jgi:hypothetical protein